MASSVPDNNTGSVPNLEDLRAKRDQRIYEAYQNNPTTGTAKRLAEEAGLTLRHVFRIIKDLRSAA